MGVGRVHVIPNFLDLSDEPPQPVGEVRDGFLYAGRLEDVKGVRELLEAFAGRPDGPRIRIMGRGSLESLVTQYAAQAASIEYMGAGTQDDVRRELRTSQGLVLPSIWEENCPMILLEARNSGAAVIASDRGGLPEFIAHGKDGLICRAGDVRELRAAIDRLACNPDEARHFGIVGQARVRTEHSADAHYERLIDVYGRASKAATMAKRAGLRHHRDSRRLTDALVRQ
jgi:glycosyltransferase involved in cell wall biosynthesis